MKSPLDELRNLDHLPPGPHLDDERIAELASAEAMGEDLSIRYPIEAAHLDSCVTCVDAFAELVDLITQDILEMARTSHEIPSSEVFVAMLTRAANQHFENEDALRIMARQIAGFFLTRYTETPSPGEIPERLFIEAAGRAGAPVSSHQARTLMDYVRAHVDALALFLHGAANQTWGRAFEVLSESRNLVEHLTLQPGAARAVPVMSDPGLAGDTWTLARTRLGEGLPINVTVRAHRLTPLACRLEIAVDRPGSVEAAGREVQVGYGDQVLNDSTDAAGVVRFAPVPIAALSGLEIRIQT